jgi:hypothetical protein
MTDRQTIEHAYEAQLQMLFNVFFSTCTSGGDVDDGEARFKKGLALLRTARDRAIAAL